jgi:hypothetical protein
MSKREYLNEVAPRYRTSSKKKKVKILDEFCLIYKCHRKHAIRQLNNHSIIPKPQAKKQGRPPKYKNNPELLKVIETIWFQTNQLCSKLLKSALILWLPCYPYHVSEEVIKLIKQISPATIDRILLPIRTRNRVRGRCTTKPGTLLKKHIPIKVNQWNEEKPGFLEMDTVAMCGTSLSDTFVNILDAIDIKTTWTEQRATWGKGEAAVLEQIKDIEESIPFPLLGLDADNGNEFLNRNLLKYCLNRKYPVQFTRSRAYHKNDNAHVEQKNWTHIRQWLGYDRFDNPYVVPLLNDLFKNEWRLFHNFFCPSVKLIEKERIGSKTIKKHDSPKTPYQRIMKSKHIAKESKQQLTIIFNSLNPFKLRKAIEEKLSVIFKMI